MKLIFSGIALLLSCTLQAQVTLVRQFNSGPIVFEQLGNTIIFNVRNSLNTGYELWKSDGTSLGTTHLHPLISLPGQTNHQCRVGDVLYFVAPGGLWKTDGTKEGTVVVRDNYQGTYMASLNGLLIFDVSVPPEQADRGLWRSDGTPGGTYQISEHNGNFINSAAEMDGFLYFAVSNHVDGYQLWKTDGTGEGTSMVSAEVDPILGGMTHFKDRLIFAGDLQVLVPACPGVYDPYYVKVKHLMKIENGVVSLLKTPGPIQVCNNQWPHLGNDFINTIDFVPTDQYLYFVGTEENPNSAYNLWRTDGTTEGTVKLTGFYSEGGSNQGANTGFFSNYIKTDRGFTDIFYFPARTEENGMELWRSDGTPEGTYMLMDINPGAADTNPSEIRTVNGITYFFATNNELGTELWRTDGSAAGTRPVADLNHGPENGGTLQNVNVSPYDFYGIGLGSDYYFSGTNGKQWGLYATKAPAEPFPITAQITNNWCSDCVWDLPKTGLVNGKNEYAGYTWGDETSLHATRYTLDHHEQWVFKYEEKRDPAIGWETLSSSVLVNGLRTAPKPPCSGWSGAVSLTGDCSQAEVGIDKPEGAPQMQISGMRTIGIVNGKNAYGIPVTGEADGTEVQIYWDGTRWVMARVSPDARIAGVAELSENNGDKGSNPPCEGWTNGYGLSGDVCISNTLPVTLVDFRATASEGNNVTLHWETTREEYAAYFQVDRSVDMKHFVTVGRVEAEGNSETTRKYTLTDRSPGPGINYYRLRQTDLTGEETIYKAISVKIIADGAPFPNPSQSGIVRIKSQSGEVKLIDILGNEISVSQHPAGRGYTNVVPGRRLSPGVYFLKTTSGIHKLIVN